MSLMSTDWLLVGDTHGNPGPLKGIMDLARTSLVKRVVQLGDFGYGFDKTQLKGGGTKVVCAFTAQCSKHVTRVGIPLYWIGGNHENYDLLEEHLAELEPDDEGCYELQPGVFYIPRGTLFDVDDTSILTCGGAVSVDKLWRLEYQMRTGTAIWWEDEPITDEDVALCASKGAADILLTHDFPWEVTIFDRHMTPGFGPEAVPMSALNRQRVSQILHACGATRVYHGHLHHSYQEIILDGVMVRGLNRDESPLSQQCELLEIGK
jgi:predicted phosphodiesterase